LGVFGDVRHIDIFILAGGLRADPIVVIIGDLLCPFIDVAESWQNLAPS
jgi:hypothetical protein